MVAVICGTSGRHLLVDKFGGQLEAPEAALVRKPEEPRVSESGIRVFIPDPEHGEGEWDDGATDGPVAGPSARFRQQLEAEYGERFRFISIGTGAALASYFVELISDPYKDAAVAAAVILRR